mmetsp:Transcript_47422/g.122678  ORF Transcript_47422/g.122678 Transcript_47422/m.122678 type:complete len:618 (-) Transcript_47422:1998-3851(-)
MVGKAGTQQAAAFARKWARLASWSVPADDAEKRRLLLAVVVVSLLTAGRTWVQVRVSYANKDCIDALSEKNEEKFWEAVWRFVATLVVAVPVLVFGSYLTERVIVEAVRVMTNAVLKMCLSRHVLLLINEGSKIDNPDQRIAEDIRSFVSGSVSLIKSFASTVFDLFSFSFILYSASPSLFASMIAFCIFGTAVTFLLGRPLVRKKNEGRVKSGEFRFCLSRLRDSSTSIVAWKGEEQEQRLLSLAYNDAYKTVVNILSTATLVDAFQTSYDFLISLIPLVSISGTYFRGEVEMGTVVQSLSAFRHVYSDMSYFSSHFESITTMMVVTERVGAFIDMCASPPPTWSPSALTEEERKREAVVVFDRFSLCTPTADMVASPAVIDLCMTIMKGDAVLVKGQSGVGKTSLVRAMMGLFTREEALRFRLSGGIRRPHREAVALLPQRPYLLEGKTVTLKDNMCYPAESRNVEDDVVMACARQLHLQPVVERMGGLHSTADASNQHEDGEGRRLWGSLLSPGEQQRIAMMRVMVSPGPNPLLVIIDEGTSAVDEKLQDDCYSALLTHLGVSKAGDQQGRNNMQASAVVSVGHRDSLLKHHTRVVYLKGHGEVEDTHLSLLQV